MMYIKNILKELGLPLSLIILWIVFLHYLRISSSDSQQIVLGIILGTSLGFISDIFKRGFDDFRQKNKIRKVAITLLAQDALTIFRTMQLYKSFLETKNIPDDVKKGNLPPELDLHYWKHLSSDKDFILLASEEPFNTYYRKMWDFEKLNSFKKEAEKQIMDERFKDKPKPMAMIYFTAYNQTVKDNAHEKFALNFYSKEKLDQELKKKE